MFKKSFSILLALLMMFSSLGAVQFASAEGAAPLAAPAGTGIASLSEITDPAGTYYLTADIGSADALSATTVAGSFTGTLDGKDASGKVHTIYTSVPVFAELGAGATVKNLILDGAMAVTASTGALATQTAASKTETITLTDVTNRVDITVGEITATTQVGGLIGTVSCALTATNCKNEGVLQKGTATSAGQLILGGLIGKALASSTVQTVFSGCVNTAAITVTNSTGNALVGGLVGWYNMDNPYLFQACSNAGTVTINAGATCKTGGLIGVSDKAKPHTYENCTNNGAIDAYGILGGLAGQDGGLICAKNCSNSGNITAGKAVAANVGGMIGIAGYGVASETDFILFENCVNSGNILGSTTHGTVLLGGIAGNFTPKVQCVFRLCQNSGSVSATNAAGAGTKVGGISGVIGASSGVVYLGCVNTGSVTGAKAAAGIAANLTAPAKFVGCVNQGTITLQDGLANTDYGAGGIAGICAGQKNTVYSCVNKGAVNGNNTQNPAKQYTAGIIAFPKDTSEFHFCENFGSVTGQASGLTNAIANAGTQELCHDRSAAAPEATTVSFAGVQRSTAAGTDGTISIRLVTEMTEIGRYQSAGMLVYLVQSDGTAVRYTNNSTDTVYRQISAAENGVATAYPETARDGVYYSALTVTGVAADQTYRLIVVPYTVSLDGTYAYANAYTVTITNGVLGTPTALVSAN